MSAEIPTGALSAQLEERIGGRAVKAALFTTFSFEPLFFEENVLPLLFEESFSTVSRLLRCQLEEALISGPPVAVYYDAGALVSTAGSSPALDFRKVAVFRGTGCFHPKVILLLLERPPAEGKESMGAEAALLLGVGSANLTRSGWWENLESFAFLEIGAEEKSSLREDLREFLRMLRKEAERVGDPEALGPIRRFLDREVKPFEFRTRSKVFQPRLFFGQKALPQFLAENLLLPGDRFNLEILSPYFEGSDAGPLRELVEALGPREVRLLEPQPEIQGAGASGAFIESVAQLGSRVGWGRMPEALLARKKSGVEVTRRFAHAKVLRLWSQAEGREIVAIGSANLTRAAYGQTRAGNLECMLLIENEGQAARRPVFWLEPIESEAVQAKSLSELEGEKREAIPPLSVRFDWANRRGEYCWFGEVAAAFELLGATDEPLAAVQTSGLENWASLPEDSWATLGSHLESSPLVRVRWGGRESHLLVDEIGLVHRPTLLLQLTPEEILRYWSLLSASQRQVFIEEHASDDLAVSNLAAPRLQKLGATSGLFDRFAGVFHAFARLRERILKALCEARPREAEALLLTPRHDSLPTLLDKLLKTEATLAPETAPVVPDWTLRYVTLLTARQLLQTLLSDEDAKVAEFAARHKTRLRQLLGRVSHLKQVTDQVELGSRGEKREFLEWFEKAFLAEASAGDRE